MSDPGVPDVVADRTGVSAGIVAYTIWGLFPLVFHHLGGVAPLEVLAHRIVWSLAVVLVLVRWRGPRGWLRPLRRQPRELARLAIASLLVATNWLVYIWSVDHDHVVEAALGYYVNPLITVALGVTVLGERLRRPQVVALGFGVVSVVVLTIALGRPPWIALVLASTFAGYGFQKKAVRLPAAASLAVETALLAPIAVVGLLVAEARGDAAFGHGSVGRSLLLASLGVVTAVPLLLFVVAARRIPLTLLGLLQYLTPTGQLLCGVLVLDESLSPARLAGFVLVWIALAVLALDAWGAARRRPTAVPVGELT